MNAFYILIFFRLTSVEMAKSKNHTTHNQCKYDCSDEEIRFKIVAKLLH